MRNPNEFPRYDSSQTYNWNYANSPESIEAFNVPTVDGDWTFCGKNVASPLGIPAGPLLNGRWVLYYSWLGFDVLTYKTVRSSSRVCYDLPNLLPVTCSSLKGGEQRLPTAAAMTDSWAVSFGMPSMAPDVWRRDVEQTRRQLRSDQLLVVSVVGSVQPGWNIKQLAEDYALCAKWAIESGADAVETNFSCPNVATCDGQLYQQPEQAGIVASQVRSSIGKSAIFIAKIGHVVQQANAELLLDSIGPFVNGLAMTNSVAATVELPDGELAFAGQKRGICGAACRDASLSQVSMFRQLIEASQRNIDIIGVGGIQNATDVKQYLQAGAKSCQIATAAMVDPEVGIRIRRELS